MQGQASPLIGMPLLMLLLALVAMAIGVALVLRRPRGGGDQPAQTAQLQAPGSGAANKTAGVVAIGLGALAAVIAFGSLPGPTPVSHGLPSESPVVPGEPLADPTIAPAAAVDAPQIAARAPVADMAAPGVPAGAYGCSAMQGVPPYAHVQPIAGFTVAADGSYVHQDGVRGTISVSGNVMEFHGGALDGQAATFNIGTNGRPAIHLYNESRSRTLVDCEA